MIRLALGTLAADNAHHQFEQLCRHLARHRIASNIPPATGPVSADGDQGRAFETFRTHLAEELPFALGCHQQGTAEVKQDRLRASLRLPQADPVVKRLAPTPYRNADRRQTDGLAFVRVGRGTANRLRPRRDTPM